MSGEYGFAGFDDAGILGRWSHKPGLGGPDKGAYADDIKYEPERYARTIERSIDYLDEV